MQQQCQCCCNNNGGGSNTNPKITRQRLTDDTMVLIFTAMFSLVTMGAWVAFSPL